MDTKVAITISKQKMLKTERTKCCPQVLLKDFATLIEKIAAGQNAQYFMQADTAEPKHIIFNEVKFTLCIAFNLRELS